MGYPDQALQKIRRALAIAEELAHSPSIAAARFYTAMLYQLRRDPNSARQQADAGIALSNEHGILHFLTTARQAHGWAIAALGQTEAGIASMRESIETQRAYGTEMARGYFLAMLAETHLREGQIEAGLQAVADGIETVNRTGDTYHEPELYRLKGALLLRTNAENTQAEAEACFHQAIAISQRQSAKMFELRAVMSLSLLYLQQGRESDARLKLQEIYDWFTEGFDTVDLKEAKSLLELLR